MNQTTNNAAGATEAKAYEPTQADEIEAALMFARMDLERAERNYREFHNLPTN